MYPKQKKRERACEFECDILKVKQQQQSKKSDLNKYDTHCLLYSLPQIEYFTCHIFESLSPHNHVARPTFIHCSISLIINFLFFFFFVELFHRQEFFVFGENSCHIYTWLPHFQCNFSSLEASFNANLILIFFCCFRTLQKYSFNIILTDRAYI